MTYLLQQFSSVDLGWPAGMVHVLPLDDTHSLVWGMTVATVGGNVFANRSPCKAVVVDHSDPSAPVLGSVVTVFDTADDPTPFGWTSRPHDVSGCMMLDGVTAIFCWAGTTFNAPSSRCYSRALTWDGDVGLTLQAIVGPLANPSASGSKTPYILVLSSTRATIWANGNEGRALYACSSTGLGALVHADGSYAGPDPFNSRSVHDLFRLDDTHLLWLIMPAFGVTLDGGVAGYALNVVSTVGDVFTESADFAFAYPYPNISGLFGLRPETSDPFGHFRGYGAAAGFLRGGYEYHATSAPSVSETNVLAMAANTEQDLDGIVDFGIDSPTQVVVGLYRARPNRRAEVLDYDNLTRSDDVAVSFNASTLRPGEIELTPIHAYARSLDVASTDDYLGLILVGSDATGPAVDGTVAIWRIKLKPAGWRVAYVRSC